MKSSHVTSGTSFGEGNGRKGDPTWNPLGEVLRQERCWHHPCTGGSTLHLGSPPSPSPLLISWPLLGPLGPFPASLPSGVLPSSLHSGQGAQPCPQLPGQQRTSPLSHALQRMVAAMEAAILLLSGASGSGIEKIMEDSIRAPGRPKAVDTQLPGMLVKAPRSTLGFVHPGKFGECSPSSLHCAPGKPPECPFPGR